MQGRKYNYTELKDIIENDPNFNCRFMMTEEEFNNTYENCNSKLILKCECGEIFYTTSSHIIQRNKKRCNKCNSRKKSHELFLKQVFDLVKDEYVVLGEYKTTHEHIKMKHTLCGCEYEVSPANFLRGKRCPKCNGGVSFSHEEYINKYSREGYEVLSEYKSVYQKIKVKHLSCGFEYETFPQQYKQGDECPLCCGRYKDTHIYKKEVYELVGEEYEVLGEYKKAIKSIKMIHHKCGNTVHITPNDFKEGVRCKFCNESRGEQRIRKYLTDNSIPYKTQYRIKECKNKRALPFDFVVFNNDSSIYFLIEFHGRQHYEEVYFSKNGNQKYSGLEYVKHNDNIKSNYCQLNNIELIIIPYWDLNNIETILSDKLNTAS